MPCASPEQIVSVTLDDCDRIIDYAAIPRACPAISGSPDPVVETLRGRHYREVLTSEPGAFSREGGPRSAMHVMAVQRVLAVLDGQHPGGPGDPCAAATIEHADGHLTIVARLKPEGLVKPGNCGTCRSCPRSRNPQEPQ